MKIVTGYAGQAHITSNDDQGLLQGIFGSGNYILPVRGRFAATLISSNEMQIADGEGLLQGVHFRVEPETNDSVVIENGSQGMQRIDLVCARYQKDPGTGIETMSWIVKKGTPAASNPATPSVTPGDLLAGDTLAEFPIYSIRLNGITIQSVTLLATILSPQSLIGDTSIAAIGDGTLTGAISALNSSLNDITYFTCTDAGSYYDITRQNCYAIGKRVFISVELLVTTANPLTSAPVVIVPAAYRPAASLSGKGFIFHLNPNSYRSDLRPALVEIGASGNVYQRLSSAYGLNEIVVIWAEYMCA